MKNEKDFILISIYMHLFTYILKYFVFMNFEMREMGKSFSEIFSISKSVEWNLRTKFSLSECQQVANREN